MSMIYKQTLVYNYDIFCTATLWTFFCYSRRHERVNATHLRIVVNSGQFHFGAPIGVESFTVFLDLIMHHSDFLASYVILH